MTSSKTSKLSPSRMKDYAQCPRLYYYKYELGIKTPPTQATVRGTVAHYVFEYIFDYRPESRTVDNAIDLVRPCLRMLLHPFISMHDVSIDSLEYLIRSREECFSEYFISGSEHYLNKEKETQETQRIIPDKDIEDFVASVEKSVRGWFAIEKPWKFEPTHREIYIGATVKGSYIHGYIDRLDYVASEGKPVTVYVSDYKTGKKPSPRYEDDAFFQLAVYAVVLKHMKMCQVDRLRLVYVNSDKGELSVKVTKALLDKTEQKIKAISDGIKKSREIGSWKTVKQVLCGWCYFQDVCPAFHEELDGLLPEDIELRLTRSDYIANNSL